MPLSRFHITSAKSGQLTPAEAAEHREEHEGAVTLSDRINQIKDLRDK